MRPRLPEGQPNLTAKDVATSNNTLNTLMGGRKSWMSGNSGNVGPTPRPQAQPPLMSTILPSPAPSDEPSPMTRKSPFAEANNVGSLQSSTVMQGGQQQQPAPLDSGTQMQPVSEAMSPAIPTTATSQASQPPKRRKTMSSASALPSLKVHAALIDKHIQASGGVEGLGFSVETPRFKFLRIACIGEDWFYVVLHQLFCNWTLGYQNLSGIKAFDDTETMSAGFRILGQLILDNNHLSSIHLHWFASFPSPLPDLLQRSEPYLHTTYEVAIFLRSLAWRWATFTAECRQRGYPPLVDELLNILGLLSPILQGVVFTASRRNLGVIDDEFGQRMESLFNEDRRSHWELTLRYNTAAPPTAKEIHERNAKLVDSYRKIVQKRQEILRRGSQVSPSQQTLASNAPNTPSPRSQTANPPDANSANRSSGVRPSSISASGGLRSSSNASPIVHGRPPSALGRRDPQAQYTAPPLDPAHAVRNVERRKIPGESSPVTHTPVVPSSPWPDRPQYPGGRSLSTTSTNPNHPQALHTVPIQQAQTPIHQNSSSPVWSPQTQATIIEYQQRQLEELALQRQMDRRRPNPGHQTVAVPVSSSPQGVNASAGTIPAAAFSTRPGETLRNLNPGVAGSQTMSLRQGYGQNALMPPSDYVPPTPATVATPELSALHQAHLRSPRLSTVNAQRSQQMRSPQRWYQAVKDFAVRPTLLSSSKSLSSFEFRVPESDIAKVAKDQSLGSSLAVRELAQGSIQYRVRCIQVKTDKAAIPISEWVVTECTWPPTIFLEINNRILEVRRKRQHGKDIPIDITPYIATSSQDVNRIQVSLLRPGKPQKDVHFGFAVEVIEVLHHTQILGFVSQNRIPVKDTVQKIEASLSSLSGHGDDEITMVTSDLNIELTDPFMAKIFDVPVRGSSCLHRECFDLETFLTTRTSKSKRPEEPCMIDVWKCPLCGSDARPYSLRVDDFLVWVRQKLGADGKLDCKAITVNATGQWGPKPEPVRKRSSSRAGLDEKVEDRELHMGNWRLGTQSSSRATSKEIEVVALDDD